jgi:hypothetical protein
MSVDGKQESLKSFWIYQIGCLAGITLVTNVAQALGS